MRRRRRRRAGFRGWSRARLAVASIVSRERRTARCTGLVCWSGLASMEEGRRLQQISRTTKDPVRLRRAIVVMMSAQGQSVKDITSLMQVRED